MHKAKITSIIMTARTDKTGMVIDKAVSLPCPLETELAPPVAKSHI